MLRLLFTTLVAVFFTCSGCSYPTSTKSDTKNKTAKKPTLKAPPGPASKQRQAFNAGGGKSLGSSAGVDWTPDLKSADNDMVKTAINELKNSGTKSAIPALEQVAKTHKDPDIRSRAQEAVTSLKNRK